MSEKQPMQADGGGTEPAVPDDKGEVASRRGANNAGESGGGAYPNPHTGKQGSGFEGGQSGKAYHGAGRENAQTEE